MTPIQGRRATDDPTRKRRRPSAPVVVGGLGGAAFAPVLIWLATLANFEMPPEVAASLGSLIGAAIAYLTRGGRTA